MSARSWGRGTEGARRSRRFSILLPARSWMNECACIYRTLMRRKRRAPMTMPGRVFFATPVLLLLMCLLANAAPQPALQGHVPAAVARLAPVGRVDGTASMNLVIGLPL